MLSLEYDVNHINESLNTGLDRHLQSSEHNGNKTVPREYILFEFKFNSPSSTRTADHVKIVAGLWITDIGKQSFQNIERSQPSNAAAIKT